MFCYQCEQTFRSGGSVGCSVKGVCGKDAPTSDLQDLLVYAAKGIAQYDRAAREAGSVDAEAARFATFALFTTMTNVNFSPARFTALLAEAAAVRDRARQRYAAAARVLGSEPETLTGPAAWQPAPDEDGLLLQAADAGIRAGLEIVGPDIVGLRALVLYGLKGTCAYYHHATVLGRTDDGIDADIVALLAFLAERPTSSEELLAATLRVGRLNLRVMSLLEQANTGAFGAQQPTAVRTTPVPGRAILVSGHDLADLAAVLEVTAGTGINVYTHGELLPGHGYPELKKHDHLVGNYGGAWQDQQRDFAAFPGAILMTSNCLIEPKPAYRSRLFTTGPTGWPGVPHLDRDDLAPLLATAQQLPGFTEDLDESTITTGFGKDAVLGLADQVLDAVKAGQISHFFVIGGCDGAAPGRNYYAEVAERVPDDAIILTLGCAKYRFNGRDFGEIGGIPRLLDIGQCNDSYGALLIAQALAEQLGVEVNELPLTLVVSWFEQKAVAVFCSLLALGLRGVSVGPTLPAFLTPAVLAVLVEQFGVRPVGDPAADVAAAVGAS